MTFNEAANAASKLTNFLETVERCRAVLSSAASAEQEESGLREKIALHNQAIEKLDNTLAERRAELASVNAQVERAREQVTTILAEGRSTADRLLTEVQAAVKLEREQAAAYVATAKKTAEQERLNLAAVLTDVAKAKEDLAAALKKIADAKAAALAALS